jgi:hypothetical protein
LYLVSSAVHQYLQQWVVTWIVVIRFYQGKQKNKKKAKFLPHAKTAAGT